MFIGVNTIQQYIDALKKLDWTQEMINGFQKMTYNDGLQYAGCMVRYFYPVHTGICI